MAKNEARHHHHIPQYYLRGFATGSGAKARVTVAALKAQNFFETNPRNIGGEKDFLRIDIEGYAPDSLEKAMADFDAQGAAAIKNVSKSHSFEGDDRIMILNLIALFAVRSPQMRENWRQFQERIMKMTMSMTLSTKDRWESQVRKMKVAGIEISEDVTYEQLKEFHERGEYDITMNREWHIGLELKGFDAVLRALADRKWRLYVAEEKNGPFVTSDRPVVLTWNHPQKIPVMMRNSPGFGMPDTEVYFPLTHRMTLVGAFEDEKEGTHPAEMPMIAIANTRMIEHAFEQLYTTNKTFPYIAPSFNIYQDALFMERFAAERKRRDADEKAISDTLAK